MTAPVTVIVPVYGGLEYTERCLESVVRHGATGRTPLELLVIDDASPEQPLREYVDRFASQPAPFPVTVLHNEENLGFVRTVNRGLRHARGDVVVLNSDTAVTDGWLDRLADAAALADVATVTPLTSHGSICTLPAAVIDAFALESADPRIDECAAFVREQSLRLRPEVITGVGFCMYVTRRALDLCGAVRRGDVRPRVRRGGRLLPAGDARRAPAPRRGLDVRVPPGRRVVRRRSERRVEPQLGAHRRPVPVLPSDQYARTLRQSAGGSVRGAGARAASNATIGARTCSTSCTARSTPPAAPRSTSRRCSRRSHPTSTSRCCTRSTRVSRCTRTGRSTAGGSSPSSSSPGPRSRSRA